MASTSSESPTTDDCDRQQKRPSETTDGPDNKTPRRESSQNFLLEMASLINNQTNALETLLSQFQDTSDEEDEQNETNQGSSNADSNANPSGGAPQLILPPLTTTITSKITKADPILADQGKRCQRLGEDGWKRVRFNEVQKLFHVTPVFSALKVDNLPGTSAAPSLTMQLEKADMTLGAITYGLLQQRKAFVEACKGLNQRTKSKIQKRLLAPESPFRKVSDDILQYTCGRRAQIIQQRRELYKCRNRALNKVLHDIPPSETHLFAQEKLSDLVHNYGGTQEFFYSDFNARSKSSRSSRRSRRTRRHSEN